MNIHFDTGIGTAHIHKDSLDNIVQSWKQKCADTLFIDTAITYNTESFIGDLIRKKKIPRNQLFIGSKINFANQEIGASFALERSLNNLGISVIDLYSIHSPRYSNYKKTWNELEQLQRAGKVTHLGLSSFEVHQMTDIQNIAESTIYSNQIMLDPQDYPAKTICWCLEHDIKVHICAPFYFLRNRGSDLFVRIEKLARDNECSPHVLLLNWMRQQSFTPILGTNNCLHFWDNINQKVELPISDMKRLGFPIFI